MPAAPPRLSVVTLANGPAPRVAASLRRLRRVAHEIVVAADAAVDPDELGPLRAASDRLVRIEDPAPTGQTLRWLHGLATGDWVLRLEGDEVVGDALVRMLDTPGWDRGITHAWVLRRWLHGGPDRMLDQPPWWPNPVLRLVRNVPGLVRFGGASGDTEVGGAGRQVDVPIYALDLLVHDETTRRAAAEARERRVPGRRTDRGWATATTLRVPEVVPGRLRTAPVPTVDVAGVEAVLAATELTAQPAGGWPAPPSATVEPVVRRADRRAAPPAPGTSRVRILAHDPVAAVAGRPTVLTVAVTNRSAHTWAREDEPPTRVGARLLGHDGALVSELRADLPGPVAPGQEALVPLEVPPLEEGARHRVEVGLVQEGVAWHDARASVGLHVRPGRRVLIATGIGVDPHLGPDLTTRELLAALARELPDVVPVLLARSAGPFRERFGCEVAPSPAAMPTTERGRTAEPGRRSRDLVAQARRLAKGEPPGDPVVAEHLAAFADADALIVAPGGGLATPRLGSDLLPSALEALVARAFDVPVLVEGATIGPLESRREQAAVAQIIEDADRVAVRDRSSADVARRVGRVVDAAVVPDPATAALRALGPATATARGWLDRHGVVPEVAYAVVSLRAERDRPEHLETVRAAVEALPDGMAVVYLPHRRGEVDDRSLLEGDPWAEKALRVWRVEDERAGAALVAGARMAIGSRFHLTALAAASGVPAVALVADDHDRRRLRAFRDWPGIRVVERKDPTAAADAVRAVVAQPRPDPTEVWDPADLVAALTRVLPELPRQL